MSSMTDISSLHKSTPRIYEKYRRETENLRSKLQNALQEIAEMKLSKVQTMRQHRNEVKRLNNLIHKNDLDIQKLIRQNISVKTEMERKLTTASRKEEVLRRRVDEAKNTSLKLKTLIDQSKKLKQLSDPKRMSFESTKKFLDSEIALLHSVMESKVTVKSLMTEKATLEKLLSEYEANGLLNESTQSRLSTMIDEIRLCDNQIRENQLHLNSVDIKGRLRIISEGMATLKASNFALDYVLMHLMTTHEQLAELKSDYRDLEMANEYNRRQLEVQHFEKEYEQQKSTRTMRTMEYEVYKKLYAYMQSTEAHLTDDGEADANVWMSRAYFDELKQNLTLKLRVLGLERRFGKQMIDERIAYEEEMERKASAMDNKMSTIIRNWTMPKKVKDLNDETDSDSSSYKSLEDPDVELKVKKDAKSGRLMIDGVRYDLLKKISDDARRRNGEDPDADDEQDEEFDLRFSSTPMIEATEPKQQKWPGFKIYESEQKVDDKATGATATAVTGEEKHVTELSAEDKQRKSRAASSIFFFKTLPDELQPKKLTFEESFYDP